MKDQVYFCAAVNNYDELPDVDPQHRAAVAHDKSKTDEYCLFIYTEGKWSEESLPWTSQEKIQC